MNLKEKRVKKEVGGEGRKQKSNLIGYIMKPVNDLKVRQIGSARIDQDRPR